MGSRLKRLIDWLGVGAFSFQAARIGEADQALVNDIKRTGKPHLWPGAVRNRSTLDADTSRILGKLEELRVLDVDFDVHGSAQHRYECQPMSSAEIASIEKAICTEVPVECRHWMAAVGAGAGPGYGFEFQPLYYPAPKHEGPLISVRRPQLSRSADALPAWLRARFDSNRLWSSTRARDRRHGGDGHCPRWGGGFVFAGHMEIRGPSVANVLSVA